MKLGVIVGRFQVPELHDGHRKLIEYVKAHHDQVLVLLGVSPVLGSKRNPLDYLTRAKMLAEAYPELSFAPLSDQPSDTIWSQHLDAIVKLACPVGQVMLYGGRDSFIPYYNGAYKTTDVEVGWAPTGTEVREVAANKIRVSSDFRAGIIYATANQYQRVFPTVDVAYVEDGQVLLGRKANEEKLRFPGGFVDPEDGCLERSAQRELYEETGVQAKKFDYLGSFIVRDWRYKSAEDGAIMTTFFLATGQESITLAKAADDLEELVWRRIDSITPEDVVGAHENLVACLQAHISYLPKGECSDV